MKLLMLPKVANQGDPEPDKYEACLVPYCPLFMDHVKTSLLKKSFSSLYFTVGLVQEVGELADELKKIRRKMISTAKTI